MKKVVYRIMSAVLCLFMLVSGFAGCGNSTANQTAAAATTAAATTAATAAATTEAPTAEPTETPTVTEPIKTTPPKVTITILSDQLGGVKINGVQDDSVAKKIEEITGITLDVESINTDIVPVIQAKNASGDLPDIVNLGGLKTDLLKTLVDTGSVVDMSDLITTNGANFISNPKLKNALGFSKKFMSFDTGKLFCIPWSLGTPANPANPTIGTYIRWDYYKELGYPKVTNTMDLLNVLKQIQDAHPTASNGKKAYGVSFWTDTDMWPVLVLGFVDGYAEAGDQVAPFGAIDITNDAFIPQMDNDNSSFWKYIAFYNKARQMGILDPDSFTQTMNDASQKITAGQTYFFMPSWWKGSFAGKDDSQGFELIDTTGDSNKSYAIWGCDIGACAMVISKNCKTPDRAMDLLNFFASDEAIEMIINGVKGETWNEVDGKPVVNDDIIKLVSDPKNLDAQKYGVGKYGILAAMFGGEISKNYGIPYTFTYSADYISSHMTSLDKDCADFYKVQFPGQIYTKKQYSTYPNITSSAWQPIEDKTYDQQFTNCSQYVLQNAWKLIQAKDDAEFATMKADFIKSLKDKGYDDMMAQIMKRWSDTQAAVAAANK